MYQRFRCSQWSRSFQAKNVICTWEKKYLIVWSINCYWVWDTLHVSLMKTSLVLETENKTNNVMRLSLCWIVTSVIALFSGLMMVLVFCHFLIVPHMRTKDYVTTDCIIDDIAVIPDVTNISCADLSSDMTPLLYADTSNCQVTLSKMSSSQSLQFSSNEEQIRNSHCVQVRVRYKAERWFSNVKPCYKLNH